MHTIIIMKHTLSLAARLLSLFTLCFLSLLTPQPRAEDAPKAAPEMKKVSMMIGKWKLEETDEATPFGPAGKATFKTECRYIYNGFFTEEKGVGKVSNVNVSYTILAHYDTDAHTYHFFYYDSNGVAIPSQGTVEGNTIRTHNTQTFNGKTYQIKGETNVATDGKSYTYEWQYSEDGKTWKPMFKGTATKSSH
jgi:hypothetical protein